MVERNVVVGPEGVGTKANPCRSLFPRLIVALFLTSLVGASTASAEQCDKWLPGYACAAESRSAGHVAPMTMPYLFENPHIPTEQNWVRIGHGFPSHSLVRKGEAIHTNAC